MDDKVIYSNDIGVHIGEEDVVLHLKQMTGTQGKPTTVAKVFLPKTVAAKLGVLLYPEEENTPNDDDNA